MEADKKLGAEEVANPKTIVIDYGGPNVAKPLHVWTSPLRDHRRKRKENHPFYGQ